MAFPGRPTAQPARRALGRLVVSTIFLVPLLTAPLGPSLGARVQLAVLWAAAGAAGVLLSLIGRLPIAIRLSRPGWLWAIATVASVIAGASRVAGAYAAAHLLPAFVLAMATAVCARKAGVRRRMLTAWVASGAVASVFAMGMHLAAGNPAGSPGFTGAFLALALPFAVALGRSRRRPVWLSAAITMIVAALVVSGTLATLAAGAAGVAVTMYAAGRTEARPVNVVLGSAAILATIGAPFAWSRSHTAASALAVFAALYLAWWLGSIPGFAAVRRGLVWGLAVTGLVLFAESRRMETTVWNRLALIGHSDSNNTSLRSLCWSTAAGLAARRPFLGWGPDGFRVAAPMTARDAVSLPDPLQYPHQSAHSEWYSAAVEGGAVGLVAWACVILALASVLSDRARAEQNLLRQGEDGLRKPPCCTARRRSDIAAAAFGAVTAFAIQGSVMPRGPAITLGLALCWGLAAALEPPARPRLHLPHAGFRPVGYAWCASAVLVSAALLVSALAGGRGEALRVDGRFESALPWLRLAARIDPGEPGYRYALAEAAMRAAARREGMSAMELAQEAAEESRENVRAEPTNGIWRAGLATALCYPDPAGALAQGRRAVREAPLSGTAWMALSRAYRASDNGLGEKFALRAAIESEPLDSAPFVRLAEIFRNENRPELSNFLLGRAAGLYPKSADLDAWRAGPKAAGAASASR